MNRKTDIRTLIINAIVLLAALIFLYAIIFGMILPRLTDEG